MQGFKFRCYPTPAQADILSRWIGCQRFIYNAKISEDRYFRTFAKKSLSLAGQYAPQDQQYAQFIGPDTEWLREVPSVILRNGAVRWKQAYSRYYKKLGGRPTIKKKARAQSVWLTSELFEFLPQIDPSTGEASYQLLLGTKKHPVGELSYQAHRSHAIPSSIVIRQEAGRWFVSFCNETDNSTPDPEDTAAWLESFLPDELHERTVGLDRGIKVPLMASTGAAYDLSPVQRERIAQKQASARRWQRKLARRAKGGSNRRKAAQRIACLRRYEADVRQDFAHQTSHALVADPRHLLFVFEALGVQRMTRKPKAKQDAASGKWLPNRARAKAGLNKGILSSAWGALKTYTCYKAIKAGKLVIEIAPQHTSQECSLCGHTHPDNRLSQAEFVCQQCGYRANADFNASQVIRKRGVQLILSGGYSPKAQKRVMAMRKKTKLGVERSEVTPAETQISRETLTGCAHASGMQETTTYSSG